METRKGLLTEEQEAFVSGLLDDLIDFKNPVLEGLDGPAFKVLVSVVDNNLIDKIPEEWQNPIEPILDEAMAGNWEEAADKVADLLNEKIDVPGLDEISEQLIFNAILQLILGVIMGRVEAARNN